MKKLKALLKSIKNQDLKFYLDGQFNKAYRLFQKLLKLKDYLKI